MANYLGLINCLRGLKTVKIIVKNIPINGWVSPLALARLLAIYNTNKTIKKKKKFKKN